MIGFGGCLVAKPARPIATFLDQKLLAGYSPLALAPCSAALAFGDLICRIMLYIAYN